MAANGSSVVLTKEVHHKMSKKIAQLTKVIFHLHSKNEENNHLGTALTNAYEKEIETILRDSNSIVNRQKDALEKAKESNNIKEKVKELEEKHTIEKKESQRQFDDYKLRVREKEQQVEKDYQQKVGGFKLEVLDMKKKFDSRIDEFRKQMDDYKKSNDVIDELKKAHQKELSAYVQEHNKKYNELLKEKFNSEDSLKS